MKHAFKIGQWVQSHFRANWKGKVLDGPDVNSCYDVVVLIDRHDNPMRKPERHHLHHNHLAPWSPKEEHPNHH